MQVVVTGPELRDLVNRRIVAPETKKDWWAGIREKYGIPNSTSVKVGMETGIIRNKHTSVPIEVPADVGLTGSSEPVAPWAPPADAVAAERSMLDHGVELGYGFISADNKIIAFLGEDAINAAFDSDERRSGQAILNVSVTQVD